MLATSRVTALLAVVVMLIPATSARADDAAESSAKKFKVMVDRAIQFARSQQAEDGSYSRQTGPAITALMTAALMRHGRTVSDPMIARSLKYLEGFIKPDGGIYMKDSTHRNYETCLAVLCFTEANKDGRYDQALNNAERFLKGLQWDETEDHDISSFNYGGAGYGSHKRPDLSNTQFFIEAIKATGAGADDPAMKKALAFVSRCQNLESEHNTTPFSSKINDGGFYYTPAAGGRSQAHEGLLPNGGLRSYASMTYAGLKSMIYAGLKPDDPRVKAAVEWIGKNYDLESNPGLGTSGLYYYYHTFAKALDALGVDQFKDADGNLHDWRQELINELASRQKENGSWLNTNERWLEGEPDLVTAYALMALSHCRKAPE